MRQVLRLQWKIRDPRMHSTGIFDDDACTGEEIYGHDPLSLRPYVQHVLDSGSRED